MCESFGGYERGCVRVCKLEGGCVRVCVKMGCVCERERDV